MPEVPSWSNNSVLVLRQARRIKQLNKQGKQNVHLSVEDQENLEMFERFRKTVESEQEARKLVRQTCKYHQRNHNPAQDSGETSSYRAIYTTYFMYNCALNSGLTYL